MEDFSPGLKFQSGAGLKFCSGYIYKKFQSCSENFQPCFILILHGAKFFWLPQKKSIQCLSFMFEECTILMMLVLQLNTIIIMDELCRKEIFCE